MNKLTILLAATLLISVALAACGDDDDEAGVNDPDTSATATIAGGQTRDPSKPTPAGDKPPIIIGEATVLDSGVQVLDFVNGDGPSPTANSMVLVHYTGWLGLFGPQFDSSLGIGDPVSFSLTGVIAGFAEGILGMKEGGQRRIIIPPDQAYGEAGFGDVIPPNSTLIFDVHLIEVQS